MNEALGRDMSFWFRDIIILWYYKNVAIQQAADTLENRKGRESSLSIDSRKELSHCYYYRYY